MKSSSDRFAWAGSSVKTTGWLGTRRNSAVMVPVLRAASTSHAGGDAGGWRSRLPPVMNSSATSLVTFAGRITVSQCVQRGRSTSCSVNQRCDVMSSNVAVTPSAGNSRRNFQVKLGSGAATYRSSAVWFEWARVDGCPSTCAPGRSLGARCGAAWMASGASARHTARRQPRLREVRTRAIRRLQKKARRDDHAGLQPTRDERTVT